MVGPKAERGVSAPMIAEQGVPAAEKRDSLAPGSPPGRTLLWLPVLAKAGHMVTVQEQGSHSMPCVGGKKGGLCEHIRSVQVKDSGSGTPLFCGLLMTSVISFLP